MPSLGEVQGQEATAFVDGGDVVVRSTLVQASSSMSQPDASTTRSASRRRRRCSVIDGAPVLAWHSDGLGSSTIAPSRRDLRPWSGSKLLANLIVELPVASTTTVTRTPILTPSSSRTATDAAADVAALVRTNAVAVGGPHAAAVGGLRGGYFDLPADAAR